MNLIKFVISRIALKLAVVVLIGGVFRSICLLLDPSTDPSSQTFFEKITMFATSVAVLWGLWSISGIYREPKPIVRLPETQNFAFYELTKSLQLAVQQFNEALVTSPAESAAAEKRMIIQNYTDPGSDPSPVIGKTITEIESHRKFERPEQKALILPDIVTLSPDRKKANIELQLHGVSCQQIWRLAEGRWSIDISQFYKSQQKTSGSNFA